jgi:hypothetical protein
MKPEELRYGNLVDYAGLSKVLSINPEVQFDNLYLECEESFEWTEVSKVVPISLTANLLQMLGFTYQKGGAGGQDEWSGFGFWSYKNYHFVGLCSSNKIDIQMYIDRNRDWEVKYVHQVQNLILDIMGEVLDTSKIFK